MVPEPALAHRDVQSSEHKLCKSEEERGKQLARRQVKEDCAQSPSWQAVSWLLPNVTRDSERTRADEEKLAGSSVSQAEYGKEKSPAEFGGTPAPSHGLEEE